MSVADVGVFTNIEHVSGSCFLETLLVKTPTKAKNASLVGINIVC